MGLTPGPIRMDDGLRTMDNRLNTKNPQSTIQNPSVKLPYNKDIKGLEIQVAQAMNLAIQHLIATQTQLNRDEYWKELSLLTTRYFDMLTAKKKELI